MSADEQDRPHPSNRLILPGGKVDPEALREWYERASAEGSDEEQLGTVRFELQRDVGSRLDRYLTSRVTFMSRTQLQRLIDEGGVTVNGRVGKASTKLRLNDVVEVVIPPPPSTEIQPEEMPLEVMFEDEHLIVLNKRADVIVHPARSELSGTLINGLAWHFQNVSGGALSGVGREFARPGVVHRLDRNTTGCIVFAKTDEAHWKLGRQFEMRSVDKRYLALVHGRVEPEGQVIDLPIGPHPSREKGYREKYVVRHDDLGKPSVTIARVRERYGEQVEATEGPSGQVENAEVNERAERASMKGRLPGGWGQAESAAWLRRSGAPSPGRYTLVELELKTGRTHQIRVHLSHHGWAIVGDDMYGGRALADDRGATLIARQALHAALLSFEHPISGKAMTFVAPLPADLRASIDFLRSRGCVPVHVDGTVPMKRLGLDAT
ncbi:MAG: RluA family pseudouridine synthase [Phycisphaerales bacterium]|nr:RluA family pseudouridine synthase [Phycisphaerales bacterium]